MESFLCTEKEGNRSGSEEDDESGSLDDHSVSSRAQMYTIESKKRRDKGSKTPLIGWGEEGSSYDANAPE